MDLETQQEDSSLKIVSINSKNTHLKSAGKNKQN